VALATPGLGNRFKENLNKALADGGFTPIDWGKGLWQKVLEVYQLRKDYVHQNLPQTRLFAPVAEAEMAIDTLRKAIKDILHTAGKGGGEWADDDSDDGWSGAGAMTGTLHTTVIRRGADKEDPDTIRICYVYKGEEKETEILPPGSDWEEPLTRLTEDVALPITAVRAYRGNTLLKDIALRPRGS
jgi:hypothetical protein